MVHYEHGLYDHMAVPYRTGGCKSDTRVSIQTSFDKIWLQGFRPPTFAVISRRTERGGELSGLSFKGELVPLMKTLPL